MSDKTINSIKISNRSITPKLNHYGTKTRVEFNGRCLKQDKVTFNHEKVVTYLHCLWGKSINMSDYPTLENCLFGVVFLIKMLISLSTNILDMELDLIDMEVFHLLVLDSSNMK